MSEHTLLVVDDDAGMRAALADTLSDSGFSVLVADSAGAALNVLQSEAVSLVLSDVQMEGPSGADLMRMIRERDANLPIILMSAYGTIDEAVSAMLDGAAHYLVKPFDIDQLVSMIRKLLPELLVNESLVAADQRTLELLQTVRLVAASDATVCLSGESGSGKEVFAQEIHRCSPRNGKELVAINCAAIPNNMLEALLFGHVKGAFTGATADSPGKFEQAQHSTLLLDEITEMDLALQAKLLRVLQEKEVERLGSTRRIALDVRIIATTNRDLRGEVEAGRFREDLYYRLNVFPIQIPPLRERPADIIPLTEFLMRKHGGQSTLSDDAATALVQYAWPGNVRELDNVIQRSQILANGRKITAAHLGLPQSPVALVAESDLHSELLDHESKTIIAALSSTTGNKGRAAEKLGISPRTLRYKLARLRKAGVPIPDTRSAQHA